MKAVNLLVGIVFSLTFVAGGPLSAMARSDSIREALLSEGIVKLLSERHLRKRALDDATSKTAFNIFLTMLDPGKLYFTQADVKQLRRYETQLDNHLADGRLDLAYQAGDLKRQRIKRVAGWVEELLRQPFNLSLDERYETDSKARAFSQNDAALQDRWRRELKREVLVYMHREKNRRAEPDAEAKDKPEPATPKTDDELEAEARPKLSKRYSDRFHRLAQQTPDDDVELFLNAFVEVYDPHTAYLSPYRKENLDIRMSGTLEGIGALLGMEEGLVKVQRIVPGSASWRQGQLKAEDVILAVAQGDGEPVDVVDTRLRDVVQLIRGRKGTIVKLSVRKPDGAIVVVPIKRDVVRLEDAYVKAAILRARPGSAPFAYIHLPRFYGNVRGRAGKDVRRQASEDVHRALVQMRRDRILGLILDMRGNSGGLLEEAVRLSGLFIKTGPVVAIRDADGARRVKKDRDPDIDYDGPVVVLVDRFSASASEIVAAALQDYGRAVVVGSTTHGKGTVQYLESLDRAVNSALRLPRDAMRLGTLKLTRYQFYRINGGSTQMRGVTPDIELPDAVAHLETGEGAKEHAIPWNTIEPERYKRLKPAWRPDQLRLSSQKRQADNAAFAKVKARSELLSHRRENTVENLQKDVWFQARKQEFDELEALKLGDEKRFDVKPVAYAINPEVPAETRTAQEAEWVKDIQDDPWLEEALHIIADMAGGASKPDLAHDRRQ